MLICPFRDPRGSDWERGQVWRNTCLFALQEWAEGGIAGISFFDKAQSNSLDVPENLKCLIEQGLSKLSGDECCQEYISYLQLNGMGRQYMRRYQWTSILLWWGIVFFGCYGTRKRRWISGVAKVKKGSRMVVITTETRDTMRNFKGIRQKSNSRAFNWTTRWEEACESGRCCSAVAARIRPRTSVSGSAK